MAESGFTISCATCAYQHSSECDDCVVTFVLGRDPEDAIVIDASEARAMRMLERAGLLPALRHEERVG